MVKHEFLWCHISKRTVSAFFVVFPAPGFDHELRFLEGQKPVLIETFIPKLAVEALDKGVLQPVSRLNEVQVHAMLSRSGIQRCAREFRTIV